MKNKTFTRFSSFISNVKKKKIASLMTGGYLKEDCLPTLVGRSPLTRIRQKVKSCHSSSSSFRLDFCQRREQ